MRFENDEQPLLHGTMQTKNNKLKTFIKQKKTMKQMTRGFKITTRRGESGGVSKEKRNRLCVPRNFLRRWF